MGRLNFRSRRGGFTIVELIVVISVIAILAAIVIFSLGAWQKSVRSNAVKSDLTAVGALMESLRNTPGATGYPLSTDPDPAFTRSAGVLIDFTIKSATIYCVDGGSSDDSSIHYYMYSKTKEQGPVEGTCDDRPDMTPPVAPSSVTIPTSTGTTATVNWPSVTDAASYIAQCASDPAFIYGPQQTITTQVPGTVAATVINLTPSTAFFCRVKAINTKGSSAWSLSSSSQTSPLTTPTGLALTLGAANRINYSWSAVSGSTSYNIQRSTDASFTTPIVTVNQAATSGFSIGLASNTTYYYRVQAVQSPVSSAYSTAVPLTTCPTGFITVPGSSTYGTSTFCIMKYEAKQDAGTTPISQASGVPWGSVIQTNAATYSQNVLGCSGCHLTTEAEWLTVMQNVLGVNSNWSGGSPGSGYIYSGHNDGTPANGLAADADDANGYSGTGQSSGNQRRTLTLSNGEVIWDFAGDMWEWTSGTASGGQPGFASYAWREWTAVAGTGTLSPSPFPSVAIPAGSGWTATQGIGRVYSHSTDAALKGFARGGNWAETTNAGVTALSLNNAPTGVVVSMGFRVAR